MSLRRRVALTFGGLAAIIVIGLVLAISLASGSTIRSATDDQLANRASVIRALSPDDRERLLEIIATARFDTAFDAQLTDPSFTMQVIGPAGAIVGSQDLPVDIGVVTDVARTGTDVYRTLDVDGRKLRVLTTASDDGVIQVATDVTAVEDGLITLRRVVLIAGLIGVAAAAGVGVIGSGRLVQPIKDVTAAAKKLSPGGELPGPIATRRTDEVGDLASTFNTMLAELELSHAQQERLVADASHELRTPLTSLRLKLEFMASEPGLPVEQRQAIIDGATIELEALTELIEEVTELASLSTNQESVELVDLGELVEDTARRARLTTGRTITTSTTGTQLEARPTMVRRALSNLITNAHKYSPTGEPIEIREEDGRIEVRDHGPGFSAADRDRAFDRFFRGHATQHIAGTGIGLSIVKQVAQTHGGDVWLHDDPTGGAIVGFSLDAPSTDAST